MTPPSVAGLATQIAGRGVPRVFGITGSGASLALIDALASYGVPFHLCGTEGSAALMAGTIGRLTGRAGVSVSIKGPGLANAIPGLAAAALEAFPLVHVTEAYPPDAPAGKAHKRMDHATLGCAVAKGTRPLHTGTGFDAMAAWAEAEVPGPVILELAGPVDTVDPIPRATPAPAGAIADLPRGAERPVVIAGTLAVRMGLGPQLAALGLPVFTTAAAKGVIDERLPHAAGVLTGVGLDLTPEHAILPAADLVVAIGVRPNEMLATAPFPCPAVLIDQVEPPGSDGFGFGPLLRPDALPTVLGQLAQRSWGADLLATARARIAAAVDKPGLPGGHLRLLQDRLGTDARFVLDTGYFCTVAEHALLAVDPGLCLLSGQGRYMGTGIPMAVAATLHDPGRPTVLVTGDGGIAMATSDLVLAAEARAPLLVVLMTDGGFGSVRAAARARGYGFGPITTARSWVGALDGLGIPGLRLPEGRTDAALVDALAAWDPAAGPAFIEIPYPPEPYEQMVAGIRA